MWLIIIFVFNKKWVERLFLDLELVFPEIKILQWWPNLKFYATVNIIKYALTSKEAHF